MRSWWRDDPWGIKAVPAALWWAVVSIGRLLLEWAGQSIGRFIRRWFS